MKKFEFAYKIPDKAKVRHHIVYAESDHEAIKNAPEELDHGFRFAGLLREIPTEVKEIK